MAQTPHSQRGGGQQRTCEEGIFEEGQKAAPTKSGGGTWRRWRRECSTIIEEGEEQSGDSSNVAANARSSAGASSHPMPEAATFWELLELLGTLHERELASVRAQGYAGKDACVVTDGCPSGASEDDADEPSPFCKAPAIQSYNRKFAPASPLATGAASENALEDAAAKGVCNAAEVASAAVSCTSPSPLRALPGLPIGGKERVRGYIVANAASRTEEDDEATGLLSDGGGLATEDTTRERSSFNSGESPCVDSEERATSRPDSLHTDDDGEHGSREDSPTNSEPRQRRLSVASMFDFQLEEDYRERAEEDEIIARKTGGSSVKFRAIVGAAAPLTMGHFFRGWAEFVHGLNASLQLDLLPCWNEAPAHARTGAQTGRRKGLNQKMSTSSFDGGDSSGQIARLTTESDKQPPPCYIMSPTDSRRGVWDIFSFALLAWDVVMIPMGAFSPPRTIAIEIMDWAALIFWSLDVIASCTTGFPEEGSVNMKPHDIICHYLRTGFLLDVVTLLPDWSFTLMDMLRSDGDSGADAGSGGKMLRAFRMMRILRLLRLSKFGRITARIRDQIDSEYTFIIVNVLKLMFMLLILNHFIASTWYALGNVYSVGDPSWIDLAQIRDRSLGYRYATSIHWSMTQFTPGSMDVQPTNILERIYNVTVLFLGLVIFSSFTASITASMTQLRNLNDASWKDLWLLRRYLKQRKVPSELSFRILRYIEFACAQRKDLIQEGSVAGLALLSDRLRTELSFYSSYLCIQAHPLFEYMRAVVPDLLHALSMHGFSKIRLAAQDLLFAEFQTATAMYVVESGQLEYIKTRDLDEDDLLNQGSLFLDSGDWASEMALWTKWTYRGELRAMSECELIAIDAEGFAKMALDDVRAWDIIVSYAMQYMDWINTVPSKEVVDIGVGDDMHSLLEAFLRTDYDSDEEAAGRTSTFSLMSNPRKGSLQRQRSKQLGRGSIIISWFCYVCQLYRCVSRRKTSRRKNSTGSFTTTGRRSIGSFS
eukprot:TRINITY_DN92675_c0_g1_i1.p1 TRINITY_DN92675_c0_g1~~TRINITY_DN92675_c0_g1_i1.p1  ORF type:complete len:995 (+),score=188.88 TRINITY_DN92675_c0_g1_i1:128-3112(+)